MSFDDLFPESYMYRELVNIVSYRQDAE